ncbi:hypothetical protein Tco_1058220 [Tanacetum coccineum]|uniref:Uncharacterized protein n=1 Tax=Tanacetum coccineum TaxID=301880 RepID=A0ABQ5H838_9ASTR
MVINNMYQPERTFMTMINKCLTGKTSGFDRPKLALLQVLWGMITNLNVDYAELIWEDFKFQIDSKEISKKKKELLLFPRFTKLIIKHILSYHNNVSKRLQSYHHVIKIDATLGNQKFINNGAKEPIYGMGIPLEMMSYAIKTSADYLNYLAKSKGNQPDKDHSKKLKGIETLSAIVQFMIYMKESRKASKDDFILQQRHKGSGEGFGVIPEVPDGPSGSSSSSSSESDDEVEDISSDKERTEADGSKKAKEENSREEQPVDDQTDKVQAKVLVPDPQAKKHAEQLPQL